MKPTLHRTPYLDDHIFMCERGNGLWHCYGYRHNQRVYMNYMWYTKREAITRFKQHLQDVYGNNTI